MPWVLDQKRKATPQDGIGIGVEHDATNLLKLNEENKLDKFSAIEQTT